MGLKRFSGDFSYRKNGQTKNVTVVSPVVEENSTLTIYSSAAYHAYTERHAFAQWTPNPFFSRFAIPYYWNDETAFDLSAKMIEGTQYGSFTALVEAFTHIALAELESPAAVGVILDSRDYPQFSSQEQGCFGTRNSNSFTMPYIQIKVEASAINVQLQRSCLVEFSFWLGEAGVFNTSTGLWPKTGGLTLNIQSTSNNVYNSSEIDQAKIAFINDAIKIRTMPGVGATITAGGTQFQFGNPGSYVWLWFLINDADVFIDSVSFIGTLCFYKFAVRNTTCAWHNSGDVDPTDPWTEPDPYDPVPPGPIPPGPVDPTDPVDPVPEPDMPPIGGASIGIYTVYKPSSSQLQAIANKLWDPTAWDAIKQMFTNPMDAIMGLSIVPVTPITSVSRNVYLGRYNTEVSVPVVASDYVTVDCGSVAISKFYGSYLDHDPYTKYHLYLPYVGEIDINADEITGKTVHVKYHCNVVTGDCVAVVLINNRSCYTAMGNIIRQLPLSQTDFTSVIQTAVSAASTMLQSAQSTAAGAERAAAGAATGNATMAMNGGIQAATAALNGVTSTVNTLASAKLSYKHSGKIGQGAAQMSVQKPFFTVTRPNIALPEGIDGARNSSQKRYTGYPANYIDELRNFHGFTIVEEAQLNMLGATDREIAEATAILKGGVYL